MTSVVSDTDLVVLGPDAWHPRRLAHGERVDEMIGAYLERRAVGEPHPVLDFLFTYYSLKPGHLRRWHPGHGSVLTGPGIEDYRGRSGYVDVAVGGRPGVTVSSKFLDRRSSAIEFVSTLIGRTATRPAQLGCFGLHEWAMVYRGGDEALRHDVPLRLGHDGTDAVVESMPLRCTHYDAFRFFTPDAVPRNALELTPEHRLLTEQPGCLHASMDLYKWVAKLGPLLPSELLLDCFALSMTARELDMRASPYDLTAYGYSPVRVETPTGRAEYVRAQSAIAERGAAQRVAIGGLLADLR
ncbi:3-methyladenine DNA glycosylase [Rhodococcus sp. BP-332]|uniref:3-methyladenine DNA glycosylase n=1 Tax=Rhodococcus sp. BP-332 TaxID=2739447 RepID=UPI0035AB8FAB